MARKIRKIPLIGRLRTDFNPPPFVRNPGPGGQFPTDPIGRNPGPGDLLPEVDGPDIHPRLPEDFLPAPEGSEESDLGTPTASGALRLGRGGIAATRRIKSGKRKLRRPGVG